MDAEALAGEGDACLRDEPGGGDADHRHGDEWKTQQGRPQGAEFHYETGRSAAHDDAQESDQFEHAVCFGELLVVEDFGHDSQKGRAEKGALKGHQEEGDEERGETEPLDPHQRDQPETHDGEFGDLCPHEDMAFPEAVTQPPRHGGEHDEGQHEDHRAESDDRRLRGRVLQQLDCYQNAHALKGIIIEVAQELGRSERPEPLPHGLLPVCDR